MTMTTYLRILCGIGLCTIPFLRPLAQDAIANTDLTESDLTVFINYGDKETIGHLFDNSLVTTYAVEKSNETWNLDLYSPIPLFVTGVNIVNGAGGRENDPSAWNIRSSDDGTNWGRALKSVSSQRFEAPFYANYLPLNNNAARKWWRISITAINGGEFLELSEIQLLGYRGDLQCASDGVLDLTGAEITSSWSTANGNLTHLAGNDVTKTVAFSGVNGGYIQYALPRAIQLKGYRLTTGADRNSAPCSWILKGSADGDHWEVIDRQTNRNFFQLPYLMVNFPLGDGSKTLDWYTLAKSAQKALTTRYWDESRQYYRQHNDTPLKDYDFNYWWMAHALDVLVDGYNRRIEVGGDRAELVEYKLKMNGLYAGVPKKNTSGSGSWWNSYYDDMEWMAISALRAYQATDEDKWLKVSIQLYNYIKEGWTEVNGGGIMWEKNHPNSKNACSNGPAMILAARLYQETQEEAYLAFAKQIYDWMSVSLINDKGGVWDGYGNTNEGMVLTYNQGTWLGGCLELFKITQDEKYYHSALKTANYVVNDRRRFSPFGVLKGENSGDGGLFKGIFMRYLAQMITDNVLDEQTEEEFISYFLENGLSCYRAATLKGDNLTFGMHWSKLPVYKDTGAITTVTDCSVHLSGIMLYEMISNLERSGKLQKLLDRYDANSKKSYKYFRLEEVGRNANYNLELSKFQLLSDDDPTGMEEYVSAGDAPIMNVEKGVLSIQSDVAMDGTVSIYDMTGKLVRKDEVSGNTYAQSVSLSGYHIVHIVTAGEKYSKKLLFNSLR